MVGLSIEADSGCCRDVVATPVLTMIVVCGVKRSAGPFEGQSLWSEFKELAVTRHEKARIEPDDIGNSGAEIEIKEGV